MSDARSRSVSRKVDAMVAFNLQRTVHRGHPTETGRMLGKGRARIIRADERLVDGLVRIAKPLGSAKDLDPLMDAIGDARYVLLGEASHGTSEFYTWRTEISK